MLAYSNKKEKLLSKTKVILKKFNFLKFLEKNLQYNNRSKKLKHLIFKHKKK